MKKFIYSVLLLCSASCIQSSSNEPFSQETMPVKTLPKQATDLTTEQMQQVNCMIHQLGAEMLPKNDPRIEPLRCRKQEILNAYQDTISKTYDSFHLNNGTKYKLLCDAKTKWALDTAAVLAEIEKIVVTPQEYLDLHHKQK